MTEKTTRESQRNAKREAIELDRFIADLDNVKFTAKAEKPKGK